MTCPHFPGGANAPLVEGFGGSFSGRAAESELRLLSESESHISSLRQ